MQVTWLQSRRWITMGARRLNVLVDHRIRSRARALIVSVITAEMKRWGANRDRPIAIQGARSNAFYNASRQIASRRSILDPTATIFLKRSIMDRFIVTVDRFDRTVTPKMCIKGGVLPMFKPFELEIILIELSRHLSSHFS